MGARMVEDRIGELAAALWEAERSRTPTQPLRERVDGLGVEDAYAVQFAVAALREASGARPIGRKVGLASRAFLQRVGAREPFWAFVHDSGRHASGARLPAAAFIHPRLEVEIAVEVGLDLPGPQVTLEQARAAIVAVYPAFEIVDVRTTIVGVDVIESTADSGWNAGCVLGERIPAHGIDLSAVTATVSGVDEVGSASILLDDGPAGSLRWLAERAAAQGHPLRAGEIVLSGTLLPVLPLLAGQTITATFNGLGDEPVRVAVTGS
jgi:2-keto-4-pentenoate hydratase